MNGHSSGPHGHPTPPPHYTTEVSKDAGRATPGPAAVPGPEIGPGIAGASKGKARLALAAMLLFPFGIPSVICGHLALHRMAKGEVTIDMVDARAIAWFGLAMGYMMTALFLFMALVYFDVIL
ncbi:hypothetical protein [Actinomadura algeriensis]|uniref:DUF4190 domain-containing protein n=1 Tax=Actinomadura algeriensis TaxID=1679523 RepID=A0ABR9JTK0_9ACTN|nr:hypothetical protein [Actinomadura algeriensis]MBE1533729.1 hypothetical protein [Actinomadura algeriensis]